MESRFTIVGLGESLFDVMPGNRYRLGGAPLNVASHAHQLAAPHDGRGVIVTRVGQDALGRDLIAQVRDRGMATQYIQTDPDRPTGRANVQRSADGEFSYELTTGTAYDMLWFEADCEDLAQHCDAVCFGSLAQRDAQSRNAIHRFLDAARSAIKLFDVNLRTSRGEKFYDQRIIERSCDAATIVKCNRDELPTLCSLLRVDESPQAMIKQHKLDAFVLTDGERGTTLVMQGGEFHGEPASYEPDEHANAVGAGDAVSAAVLIGQVLQLGPQPTADLANDIGAYVATQPGATPELPSAIQQRTALQ